MLIGELARRSGLTRDTIRYYEKLGLLAAENRNVENDYKDYGRDSVDRLEHIQQFKTLGFTLREMRKLLANCQGESPCSGLPAELTLKVLAIDKQMATLRKFRASLLQMRAACNGACQAPAGIPSCVPLANSTPSASKCC